MRLDLKKVAIVIIAAVFLSSIFVAGRGKSEKVTFVIKLPEGTFSKDVGVYEKTTIAEALAQAFPSVTFENNTLKCIGSYCGSWKIYDSDGNEVSVDEEVKGGENYFLIFQFS